MTSRSVNTDNTTTPWWRSHVVLFMATVIATVVVLSLGIHNLGKSLEMSHNRILGAYLCELSYNETHPGISNASPEDFERTAGPMIEAELNKIQSEYQTMELWAAILTIVFLIFSFYSLFKSEDLLKEIKERRSNVEKLEDEISNKTKGLDSVIEKKIADASTTANNKLDAISNQAVAAKQAVDQQVAAVNVKIGDLDKWRAASVELHKKEIEKIKAEHAAELAALEKWHKESRSVLENELNKLAQEREKSMRDFDARIKSLTSRIDDLEHAGVADETDEPEEPACAEEETDNTDTDDAN